MSTIEKADQIKPSFKRILPIFLRNKREEVIPDPYVLLGIVGFIIALCLAIAVLCGFTNLCMSVLGRELSAFIFLFLIVVLVLSWAAVLFKRWICNNWEDATLEAKRDLAREQAEKGKV
jgi:high-affinity Fe2+/Pb2+ permease